MRRIWLSGWLALTAAAVAVLAQSNTAPLGARLKMRWQGDNVIFSEGGNTHEVSLREKYSAVRLDTVILQSAKESGGSIYLLLDVTGPSKLPRDSHECGAGNESNLIWLKLDKDWKVLDSRQFLYDSCWTSASANMDPPARTGDTLRAATFFKVATYTYKHPEEGLKVTDAPADK